MQVLHALHSWPGLHAGVLTLPDMPCIALPELQQVGMVMVATDVLLVCIGHISVALGATSPAVATMGTAKDSSKAKMSRKKAIVFYYKGRALYSEAPAPCPTPQSLINAWKAEFGAGAMEQANRLLRLRSDVIQVGETLKGSYFLYQAATRPAMPA